MRTRYIALSVLVVATTGTAVAFRHFADETNDSGIPIDNGTALLEAETDVFGSGAWQNMGPLSMKSHPSEVEMLMFVQSPWINRSDSVRIHASGKAGKASIEIYRFGYYDGSLAKRIFHETVDVKPQQACYRPFSDSSYARCDWTVSLEVPTDGWESGVYLAKARHLDTDYQSNQVFMIQGIAESMPIDDRETADVLLIHGSRTELVSYNTGVSDPSVGSSFYREFNDRGEKTGITYRQDYQHVLGVRRPQDLVSVRYALLSLLPVVSRLEKEGFDVTYMADAEQSKDLVSKAYESGIAAIVVVGHSEYHDEKSRAAIEALTEHSGARWLSMGANMYFEQIRLGEECGRRYARYDDDSIYCRSNPGKRTWYGRDLQRSESSYFGARYIEGHASHDVTPMDFGPTEVILGDIDAFHDATRSTAADFPIHIASYGSIETDTRKDDEVFGDTIPFKEHIQDFILVGEGTFPATDDALSVDPTFIRLKNCSELLHLASLGAGYGLIPEESDDEFYVLGNAVGSPNEEYADIIMAFIDPANERGCGMNIRN